MNPLGRLLVAYVLIFVVFSLAVVGLGRQVGPAEYLIGVIVAVGAAVYFTRKILRNRSVVESRH